MYDTSLGGARMGDQLPTNSQSFVVGFLDFMRQICARPAMWVGKEDFDLVCAFISGMISAYADLGRIPKLQNWEFGDYVRKKYEVGNNVVWMRAYTFPDDWTERQKIAQLLEDYEDFANPLTRMVMWLDDGVEDA